MSKKSLRFLISSLVLASLLSFSALADDSEVNALMYKGSYLVVNSTVGDWYQVDYEGTEGFVHSASVDYTITSEGKHGTMGTISGMSVRMYMGDSLSSPIVGYYNTGSIFRVLGISGDWVKVSSETGLVGYVTAENINITSPKNFLISGYDTEAHSIIESAREYLGVPYVWGGISPQGFDCSGLVNYVYGLHGYGLYRVTQDMYDFDGVHVERSDLRPGDIVCFGAGTWSVSHVGLYIGEGKFIHAPSSGKTVCIEQMDSGYYNNRYVGAKRIIGE